MSTRSRTSAVLAVVVLLAGCGGGGSGKDLKVTGTTTASGAPGAQTASLDMTDALSFVPNVVDAKVGTLALSVENTGTIPHNLVFKDSSLGHTDTINGHSTGTLTLTLAKAGTYRFVCTFHSGMDGQVVVSG